MAHRTSFIPVLGIAALLAGAAVIRSRIRLRRRSRRSRSPRPPSPRRRSPPRRNRRPQKPSTAKPAAEKAAAKQPNTPFPAEPPKAGVPRDFKVPEPKRFTLDNGLQVALVQWGTMPKVRVTLSMRTGNAFEKADEVWLADLTGDLMREGTSTRTAAQISEEAARMGGSLDRQRRRRYRPPSAATC